MINCIFIKIYSFNYEEKDSISYTSVFFEFFSVYSIPIAPIKL